MKYSKLKQELKELAKSIRLKKSVRKQHRFGAVPGLWADIYAYRHQHIIYCMFRHTPYEAIENPRPDNAPDWRYLERVALQIDPLRASQIDWETLRWRDVIDDTDEAA